MKLIEREEIKKIFKRMKCEKNVNNNENNCNDFVKCLNIIQSEMENDCNFLEVTFIEDETNEIVIYIYIENIVKELALKFDGFNGKFINSKFLDTGSSEIKLYPQSGELPDFYKDDKCIEFFEAFNIGCELKCDKKYYNEIKNNTYEDLINNYENIHLLSHVYLDFNSENKDGNNPNKIWNDYKNGKIKIK